MCCLRPGCRCYVSSYYITHELLFCACKLISSAAGYQLSQLSAQRRLGAVAGHVAGAPITISIGGVNLAISYGDSSVPPISLAAVASAVDAADAADAAPVVEAPKKQSTYTLADVAKHNTDSDCWVVVNGQVLDVTNFLADRKFNVIYI
jgi:hypothetical protein